METRQGDGEKRKTPHLTAASSWITLNQFEITTSTFSPIHLTAAQNGKEWCHSLLLHQAWFCYLATGQDSSAHWSNGKSFVLFGGKGWFSKRSAIRTDVLWSLTLTKWAASRQEMGKQESPVLAAVWNWMRCKARFYKHWNKNRTQKSPQFST